MYSLNEPPQTDDPLQILTYLVAELRAISLETTLPEFEGLLLSTTNEVPTKPEKGNVYYADGTNWDPGSGEGWYGYDSGGSWVKLG